MDKADMKALINLGKNMKLHEDEYWKIIKGVNCPVCEKELVENLQTKEMGCNDSKCDFNMRDQELMRTQLKNTLEATPAKPDPIEGTIEGLGKGSYVAHIIDGRIYWYFHYYDPTYVTAKRKGDTRTVRSHNGKPTDPIGWNQKSQAFESEIDPLEEESQTTLAPAPVSNIDPEKVKETLSLLKERLPVLTKRHAKGRDVLAVKEAISLLEGL